MDTCDKPSLEIVGSSRCDSVPLSQTGNWIQGGLSALLESGIALEWVVSKVIFVWLSYSALTGVVQSYLEWSDVLQAGRHRYAVSE